MVLWLEKTSTISIFFALSIKRIVKLGKEFMNI